ncbi:hypothetical protein M407DRAFT_243153 [Tulasnella calospora MUT 4182]|uniref:Uncharacterized protein n=1 Tax=Tulasnella calospora MUT 4182 TaxID=1051891 RepID=A0A0C3L2T3_9AGAM|nr:hypothetical protein M407DRAFT_243153 [Tulasnella calospora MUT 4182]
MVQERHSAIGNEDVPAYGDLAVFANNRRINEGALKTIKRESKGAEVYWEGAEWTST